MRDGIRLLNYAARQAEEEKLFARWCAGPQFSMSFNEFKQSLTPPKFMPEEALMEDIAQIMSGGG